MSDSAKAKRNSHTLFCYILHTEIWANIERVFGVTVCQDGNADSIECTSPAAII